MIRVCPVKLCTLSALDYYKYHAQENWEKNEFQLKFVYRIKHVKCYRMITIYPVHLGILSALDYFKYHVHENLKKKEFQ